MIVRFTLLSMLLAVPPLRAQAPGPLDEAASSITAQDLGGQLGILAHDSMLGRDTPSPGLERAAAYVIREFRRLGLRPAGEAGTYIQRFGVSRWTVDTAGSRLVLRAGRARDTAAFSNEVRVIGGSVTGTPIRGRALLVAGRLTETLAARPELRGRIVLLTPDYLRALPYDLGHRVDAIARVASAVILLSNRDAESLARRIEDSLEPRRSPDFRAARAGAPVLEVRDGAVRDAVEAAGLDLPQLRGLDTTIVREVPALEVELQVGRRYLARGQAPNLVAVLDGKDEGMGSEYVGFSAHLDHIGTRPGGTDSIFNGADDNASGVAGLLEIAEAFSRPEARPRRSLLFLVPSGEEPGLWGSAYWVEHPTVPLRDVVADLNMDLIGRNWTDSVIVTGPEMSTLGATLSRVSAAHPELRMWPLADRWPQERIFYRSDHYNFALKGVPVLFFTSGTHADYHQPSDVADRIDTEKAARLVRLVFRVGAAVADAPERPQWTPGSHQRLIEER